MASEFKEYAQEAGLLERDMPNPHHPLLQNDDEIRDLSDLIEARDDRTRDDLDLRQIDNDDNIDVSRELTFPKTARPANSATRTPDAGDDFNADARTHGPAIDAEEMEYRTQADFTDSMNLTDPDPNTGMDADEYLGDEMDMDRSVDITGTATGISRGMATHLPQDIGRDGFQIEEPEASGDPRALAGNDREDADDMAERIRDAAGLDDEFDPDAGVIPSARRPDVDSRDEALDATRQQK